MNSSTLTSNPGISQRSGSEFLEKVTNEAVSFCSDLLWPNARERSLEPRSDVDLNKIWWRGTLEDSNQEIRELATWSRKSKFETVDTNFDSWAESDDRAFETLSNAVNHKFGFFRARRINRLVKYLISREEDFNRQTCIESALAVAALISSNIEFETTPSFFLTDNGYFEMSWENSRNERVDVLFLGHYLEIHSQSVSGLYRASRPDHIQSIARALTN